MFKRHLLFIFIFVFSFLIKSEIHSSYVLVEDIFSDIGSDYKYLNELQILYDNGAIKLNSNGKFNPYGLLTRDEFIGINEAISCKTCIQPNVDNYYINKYITPSFFDVDKTNENFYCIEEALDNGFIKGYDLSSVCDNGNFKVGESPFCPNNTIILEEALAIVLRISGILTNEEAQKIRKDIYDGKITKDLSSDVHPKNLDGSVYSFYPDFMKALDYEVVEYDTEGNKKIYKLIELVGNKLEPKRSVTREEFLHIAHTTFKANSCMNNIPEDLALKMDILNKTCIESNTNCTFSLLDSSEYTYDFKGDIGGNINNNGLYIWNFYNNDTGEEIFKYGNYIDNFTFPSDGDWLVNLTYIDDDGNSSNVYNTISIGDSIPNQSDLNSYIITSGIIGDSPFILNLEGYSTGGEGKYTYNWDFGDGQYGFGKNNTHIYKEPGIYVVKLIVTDENGNISESTVSIEVLDKQNINVDININKGEGKLDVDFEGVITGGKGEYTYEWDFGDGTTGIGENPNHTYGEPGIYIVKLKTTDKSGDVIETITSVEILDNHNPDLNINVNKGEGELSANFDGVITGGEGEYVYEWDFGDGTTGIGKNINHIYGEPGIYIVKLKAIDENLNVIETITTVEILNNSVEVINVDLNINANKIDGELEVDFEGVITGLEGEYIYEWDFGDGTTGTGKEVPHIYGEPGIYTVKLKATDENGNITGTTIIVELTESGIIITEEGLIITNYDIIPEEEHGDYDSDGIEDNIDDCPLIFGEVENNGCPIFELSCSNNSGCPKGFECDLEISGFGVCIPLLMGNSCDYSGGSFIYGNSICNTCPCNNNLDFLSNLRKCDIIFPAILSPDDKNIYGQGKFYQIK